MRKRGSPAALELFVNLNPTVPNINVVQEQGARHWVEGGKFVKQRAGMVQVVAFSAVVSGDNHSSAAEARKSRDMEMQTIRHATIHIQPTVQLSD